MVDQFILIYEYNELTAEAAITNIIHQSMVKRNKNLKDRKIHGNYN